MKLTIGIPIYNAEKYIDRCLDSVLRTDLDEYEIICLNDGSTDASLEILKKYALANRNLRVISTKNRGAFIARSKIIDEAQGEWIGFVDADDVIDPQMYKILLAETGKNQHIDMVVCAFNKVDSEVGKVRAVQMNSYGNAILDFVETPEERGLLAGVNPAYWNKVYKREKLKNRLRLEYSPKIMEDYLFAASVFPVVEGVAFVEKPLYNYYDVPLSVTKKIGWNELEDAENGLRDLAIYLDNTEWFHKDIYKHDLVTAMACVHLGIAFTVNWNDDVKGRSRKDVWMDTRAFLDEEFTGWEENTYVNFRYIAKRRVLFKLYLSNKLFRFRIWTVIIKAYQMLCHIIGKDLKW